LESGAKKRAGFAIIYRKQKELAITSENLEKIDITENKALRVSSATRVMEKKGG
jgi:hypothetical protein